MQSANSARIRDKQVAAAPGQSAGEASKKGYDFSKSGIENITQRRFNFVGVGSQPVSVDQTLAHLFDTLSVECRYCSLRHVL